MHLAKLGEEKMTDPCSKLEMNTCLRDLFPPKHSFWATWLSARERRDKSLPEMSPKKRVRKKDSSAEPTIAVVTTCKYSCRLVRS